MTAASRWFHRPDPRPHARIRLVCLPYAGAGAAVFKGWAERLAADVEPLWVRLPGRENRLRERPLAQWPELVDEFAAALTEEVPSPYVLFGHSMGGMVVYKTVTSTALSRVPERVVISACRAPDVPRAVPALHELPEEEFARGLADLGGVPAEVLAGRGLFRMLEPMLRADLRLAETWPPDPPGPVPVPLTVLWGDADHVAPRAAVEAWRRLALGGYRGREVAGGHFFLTDPAAGVVELLNREIGGCG
ncbi:thioesterase II family protein [Streptomyces caelestis]|jgi:medium-chain acyl-[acyl-carrier-protein] hydrolase|uniref:Medium-chain acyl-[acyl-carrier-protein] hydrolase n=1 Tax=Streptomyces caelestis TaxID=36816 RepID=A0A7W9HA85_9ACTN|nr:alpha/beta fold hydrolase [Streptomyces caelestis]MBB5798544.1 medium-chain acyl-[acyl-carrier-protein] hydrolase [Streptomyces caelestis]GGW51119.1 thioesterase [Streptomyces caelestis]